MKTRTINDIPANRVACYEWKDVEKTFPAKDAVVCVSVPFSAPPRAVATFDGEKFLLAGTQIILAGVTFWCHAPLTPEDLDAEAAIEKKNASAEPELFK
jgi:hypothetical protein